MSREWKCMLLVELSEREKDDLKSSVMGFGPLKFHTFPKFLI